MVKENETVVSCWGEAVPATGLGSALGGGTNENAGAVSTLAGALCKGLSISFLSVSGIEGLGDALTGELDKTGVLPRSLDALVDVDA